MEQVIRLECIVPPAAWKNFRLRILEHPDCRQFTIIENATGRIDGMEKEGDLPVNVMRDRLVIAVFPSPISDQIKITLRQLLEDRGGSCLASEMQLWL